MKALPAENQPSEAELLAGSLAEIATIAQIRDRAEHNLRFVLAIDSVLLLLRTHKHTETETKA
jgi:hypothetical protein